MPNRILKQSICTSPTLNKVSAEAEPLFYRLIVSVDDFGRLEANTKVLRSTCFPLKIDAIPDTDMERWVKDLDRAGLITLYEVGGRRYLELKTFRQHNKVRAIKSKYPSPNGTKPEDAKDGEDVGSVEASSGTGKFRKGKYGKLTKS